MQVVRWYGACKLRQWAGKHWGDAVNIETARDFFLWCTIINYGVLLLWCLAFWAGHHWHYRLMRWWLPSLTSEHYKLVNLHGIAIYKIAIILLNLVPFIALRIIGPGR